jgi:glycosyltransferase involved in cell wall biosynthesis
VRQQQTGVKAIRGRLEAASITVIIPTRDEAVHIRRCVASARPLGRVIVVDSGSTDATQRIAREHGAEVVEHAWEGHAAQKNWALDTLDITTPWVLFLDADEYLTDAARAAIRSAVASNRADGFELPRAYVFLGTRLRYAWWYPDYQLRLFRRGRGRFEERRVHEHVIVDGAVAQIEMPLMHENLKGLSAFIERHNRYSDLEAAEIASPSRVRKAGALRGTWAQRRRALKDRLWWRLPARPLVRFLWLYVVRRGFLDGRRGLLFCQLIAMYDLMIDAKLMERRLEANRAVVRAVRPHPLAAASVRPSPVAGRDGGAAADAVERAS